MFIGFKTAYYVHNIHPASLFTNPSQLHSPLPLFGGPPPLRGGRLFPFLPPGGPFLSPRGGNPFGPFSTNTPFKHRPMLRVFIRDKVGVSAIDHRAIAFIEVAKPFLV